MHILYQFGDKWHSLPTIFTLGLALGAAYGAVRLALDVRSLIERIRIDPPKDKQPPTEWRRNPPTETPRQPPAGP